MNIWKRSTASAHLRREAWAVSETCAELRAELRGGGGGARDLEEVLLLALLEDRPLELDEVVRDEQREQHVVVRVDRHVQGDTLDQQDERVHGNVDERDGEVDGDRRHHRALPRRRRRLARRREQRVENVLEVVEVEVSVW